MSLTRLTLAAAAALVLVLVSAHCGGDATTDAGAVDAGPSIDASRDATGADGSSTDGSPPIDGAALDAPVDDGATTDADVDAAPPTCTGAAADGDGDGHRSTACGGDDCDDADASRFPGNPETCDATGHDEDCSATTLGPDHDGDGFVSTACCNTQPSGTVVCGTDCDDMSMDVSPAATEICDAIDDDCDGSVDEGVVTTFYRDADSDASGDGTMTVAACSAPSGYVLVAGDCDDTRVGVHPGATEVCNGLDDDCDGDTDPGCACTVGSMRACGTGDGAGGFLMVGACHPGSQSCSGGVWQSCSGNVDPTAESCNTVDDDCNGTVDDGVQTTFYRDVDADGYGLAAMTIRACTVPAGYALLVGDCDDTAPTVHPTAAELCNGRDDNCDGSVDEGVTSTYYRDVDGDGYGLTATTTSACSAPAGYASMLGDCNDASAGVHPGAGDPCDGIDNDCDGLADPGCACISGATRSCGTGDGSGGFLMVGICHPGMQTCTAGSWGACSGNVDPAPESCNTVDDDCNGVVDNGVTLTCYRDNDGDGYAPSGAVVVSTGCSCPTLTTSLAPTGVNVDCDDSVSVAHPGGIEVCDGYDGDCDGSIDEPATSPGASPSFVSTAWVQYSAGHWIMQYEASRPGATSTSQGTASNRACSVAGVLPWASLNYGAALAACTAAGATLCDETTKWQTACATGGCTWAYTTACTTFSGSTCNGIAYEPTPALLPTGSLGGCGAVTSGGIVYDMSGNASEICLARSPTVVPFRGGSAISPGAATTACTGVATGSMSVSLGNIGFRCCYAGTTPP